MVLLFDDADVLVEAEDGAGKEERLGDVVGCFVYTLQSYEK